MNIPRYVLAALIVAAANLHAGGVPDDGVLVVDCKAIHLPSQQQIGRAIGADNFDQAYAVRGRLMQTIERECLHGASHVQISTDQAAMQAGIEALAVRH